MKLFGSDAHPWVTVLAGSVLFGLVLLFTVGGYAAVMRRRTGRPVPEADPRFWRRPYSAGSIRDYVTAAGPGGRHAYRLQLWWDVVFAALAGVAGLVLLDGLAGRRFGTDRWWLLALGWSPAVAALADILEDAVLLRAVGRPPADGDDLAHPGVVAFAGWCTRAKWLLVATSLVVGAVAIVRLIQAGPGSA